MKILVVGSTGALGSQLMSSLPNHLIVGLSHSDLDITNAAGVIEAVERTAPEIAINASAFNDVDGAEHRSSDAYAVNAVGPRNLATATARAGIPILHLSTDYVFDGGLNRPYYESDLPNPLSVYGASKLAGERAVADANPRSYIVRTAWLFHETGRNFLNRMRESAMAGRRLRIVDDQTSSPTYLPHLVSAIAGLIETNAFGVRHLAGAGAVSRFDLVEAMLKACGIDTHIERTSLAKFPSRARRPGFSALSTVREPLIVLPNWREGVAQFARGCLRPCD